MYLTFSQLVLLSKCSMMAFDWCRHRCGSNHGCVFFCEFDIFIGLLYVVWLFFLDIFVLFLFVCNVEYDLVVTYREKITHTNRTVKHTKAKVTCEFILRYISCWVLVFEVWIACEFGVLKERKWNRSQTAYRLLKSAISTMPNSTDNGLHFIVESSPFEFHANLNVNFCNMSSNHDKWMFVSTRFRSPLCHCVNVRKTLIASNSRCHGSPINFNYKLFKNTHFFVSVANLMLDKNEHFFSLLCPLEPWLCDCWSRSEFSFAWWTEKVLALTILRRIDGQRRKKKPKKIWKITVRTFSIEKSFIAMCSFRNASLFRHLSHFLCVLLSREISIFSGTH